MKQQFINLLDRSGMTVTLKTRVPRFFRVLKALDTQINNAVDFSAYLRCRLSNKPYFGKYLLAGQTMATRRPWMQRAICGAITQRPDIKEPFRALEIGAWGGQSTFEWANAIKEHAAGNGTVICVDPWACYDGLYVDAGQSYYPRIMAAAMRKDRIYQLFQHNVRSSGNSEIVQTFRSLSSKAIPLLRDASFNFVYVDGSHQYDHVLDDLIKCSRVLVEGGIICGDDLELQCDAIDVEQTMKHRNTEFVLDPRTGSFFHPGVSFAVWDFFGGPVSVYDGFWLMRKKGQSWERVDLT
jgi:predicted O-methyltransferase YrrM